MVAKRLYDCTLAKYTILNSDIIASVSYSDLEYVAKEYSINEKRLRYIPNVVDTEKFKPRENNDTDEKILLYIGDLEPWKGIGLLIKWANNSWARREFKLRIVGSGTHLESLLEFQKNQSKKKNEASFEILGPVDHKDIPEIISESSALILPSYWEGMPTVILEAMASGVPTISTKVGDV